MPNEPKYLLSSVSNALEVLDFLAVHDGVGLTEISRSLNIGKATAFRLLYTLEQAGYVIKEVDGKYRLGIKFAHYGAKLAEKNDIVQVCRPFMQSFCQAYGGESHLFVLTENGMCRCIYKEFGNNPLQLGSYIGFEVAAYLSSGGKVLLANLPEDKLKSCISNYTFERFTAHSITDTAELEQQIAAIKKQGFAEDREGYRENSHCVAAPIYNWQGQCVAALSLSSNPDMIEKNRERVILSVSQAARQISAILGYIAD